MTVEPRWLQIVRPGEDPTDEQVELATRLLAPLIDPELLGSRPGLPLTRGDGTCRLCAEDRAMTFEHIPPRAAGNRSRQRGVDAVRALEADDPTTFPVSGWFQSQRGVGAYVLCEPCNNHGSERLVPAYAEMANVIVADTARLLPATDGVMAIPEIFDLTLSGFQLGAVARQALTMLMATSGGAAVTRRWPRLRELVFGEVGPLPDELSLGLSLVFGPRARLSPPVAAVSEGEVAVFCEVAAMPLAWTLSIGDGVRPTPIGVDATDWCEYALDDEPTVVLEIPVGTVTTVLPGDYRDRSTIRDES